MSENVNKDNKPLFITLGSNINPRQNLDNAINYLKDEFENIKVSNYYLTPAITGPKSTSKQEDYLNAAILTVSNLDANFIKFNILRKIEQRLGRVRTSEKFAARTMDLDIALYGPLVTHIDNVVIPDPDILRYAHIIYPLCDLDPNFIHPIKQIRLETIKSSVDNSKIINLNN